MNFFRKKNAKIFVSIASFCDDDLIKTIENVRKNAMYPENLIFGVFLQDTEENIVNFPFKNENWCKLLTIESSKSEGCCWARAKIQKLITNETYYLQLDAHCRLIKNWDVLCIKMLNSTNSKKPILTSYLNAFDKNSEDENSEMTPYKLQVPIFYDNDKMRIEPITMDDYLFHNSPIPANFFSAHFVFTYSQWTKEVPYDSQLYFEGEEDTLGARSYTNGWDMFHPHRKIGYHFYTRTGETKHHDVVETWHYSHEKSLDRMRQILGIKEIEIDLGKFGLGKVRTLKEYENRIGINFKNREIKGSERNITARKKRWIYLNGYFKREELLKWVEYFENKVIHHFIEIEHNDNHLILLDNKRNMFVKIEENKAYFKLNDSENVGNWTLFNNGYWDLPYNNINPENVKPKIFNSGFKKGLLSLSTMQTIDWAKYAAFNQMAFSKKYDYTFLLYHHLPMPKDIPHWNKIYLLKQHLKEFDFLIWIDSDAIFTKWEDKFQEIIKKYPQKSLFVCNDIGGWQLNTGVMILRNTKWMCDLLEQLWKMDHIPHSQAAEQSSLIHLLSLNDSQKKNWELFDQKEFNAHPRVHNENDFILHMMGLSGEERKSTFDNWNKKLNVYETIGNNSLF